MLFILYKLIRDAVVIGILVIFSIWLIVKYLTRALFPASRTMPGRHSVRQPTARPSSQVGPGSVGTPFNQNTLNQFTAAPPGPQTAMAASPDSISITVGNESSIFGPDNSVDEQLRYICDGFRGWEGIKLKVELQSGAFGPAGYYLLGEHVAALARTVGLDLLEEVTIRLPKKHSALESGYDGEEIDPPRLRRLFWTGHYEQLVNSWFAFTFQSLRFLNKLVLHSEINIQDYDRILLSCPDLEDLEIHWVGNASPVLQTPHYRPSSGRYRLDALRSMTISSKVDIGPLLWYFEFPKLTDIDLVLDYPNSHPEEFPWRFCESLKSVKIRACRLGPTEADRVRNQCQSVQDLVLTSKFKY